MSAVYKRARPYAQDALNLRGEYGPSSGDRRHQLAINYLWELPLGRNKPLLNHDDLMSRLFGDWQLNGTINFGSGLPFSPRVTAAAGN